MWSAMGIWQLPHQLAWFALLVLVCRCVYALCMVELICTERYVKVTACWRGLQDEIEGASVINGYFTTLRDTHLPITHIGMLLLFTYTPFFCLREECLSSKVWWLYHCDIVSSATCTLKTVNDSSCHDVKMMAMICDQHLFNVIHINF